MQIEFSTDTADVDWEALKTDLIEDNFHNERTTDELRRSFENSAVVVFARDGSRIIGKVRAISDGVCNAYVVDVWTHSAYRGQGIGTRMMEMMASKLPGQHIYLFTDTAEPFFRSLGYEAQGVGLSKVEGKWLNRIG